MSLANLARLTADPLYDPSYSQLVDCREAQFSGMSPETLRMVAARNRHSPDRRLAFVCREDAVDGIIRLYCAYLELEGGKGSTGIFRTPAKALAWIEER